VIVFGVNVYVEGTGYYRVEKSRRSIQSGFIVRLVLVSKGKYDTDIIRVGLSVIPAGVRGRDGKDGVGVAGKDGRDGKDGKDAEIDKFDDNLFLVTSPENTKRGQDEISEALSLLGIARVYVKHQTLTRASTLVTSSPRKVRDVNSGQVFTISKSCPEGRKILTGNCRWDIFQATAQDAWCQAKDFKEGKKGCKNCISNVKSEAVSLEGKQTEVVTKMIIRNEDGSEKEFHMNSKSCTALQTSKIDMDGMRDCGYFCFFQKLDPLYETENTFSCRYIPPSVFGMNTISAPSSHGGSGLEDKVQIVTVEIPCQY